MNEQRNNLDEKKNRVGRKTWSHAERQDEEDGGTTTVLSRSSEARLDPLYGVTVSSCPNKRGVSLTPVALCICYPTTMLSLNAATEITVLLGMVAHACYPALRRPGLEDSPALQSEILLRRGGREKGIALYLVFLCVSPTRL